MDSLARTKNKDSGKCPTCTRQNHPPGKKCLGENCEKCFSCGKSGHFKGAPICTRVQKDLVAVNPKKGRNLKKLERLTQMKMTAVLMKAVGPQWKLAYYSSCQSLSRKSSQHW